MSVNILKCLFRQLNSDSSKRFVWHQLNLQRNLSNNNSLGEHGRTSLNLRKSSPLSASAASSSKLPPHEERIFKTVSLEQFESLYQSDQNLQQTIANILNIYEHEKYTTSQVPTNLTIQNMEELLKVVSDEKELDRTLKFFYKVEATKYNENRKLKVKKQERIEARKKKYETADGDGMNEWSTGIWKTGGELELEYGLWHNSLLSRITKQSVRDYRQNHLLRQTAMFGQKLIIDLDYDRYMKPYECKLLAQQIGFLYYENRLNRDFPHSLPFDIHFTNCGSSTETIEALGKQMKRMDQLSDYFHDESYLELGKLFPKDRLIYLSPHARYSLSDYGHDDIFILGGYNDRTSKIRASHIKAETEGIRCFRLPLDENVLWKQGNKNLCLNQVSAILHSVKATGDWRMSIQKFAPQRKIKSIEERELEDQLRLRKMSKRMKDIQRTFSLGDDYNGDDNYGGGQRIRAGSVETPVVRRNNNNNNNKDRFTTNKDRY